VPLRLILDEFGQDFSIYFDILEMNWRILFPDNKLYIICIIYTECVYMCDSKWSREKRGNVYWFHKHSLWHSQKQIYFFY